MRKILPLLIVILALGFNIKAQDKKISASDLKVKPMLAGEIEAPVAKRNAPFYRAGETPAPADLKLEHTIFDSLVYLNWWAPGSDHWLYYHNNELSSSIGTGEAIVFDAAIKFRADQLAKYPDTRVKSIGFISTDTFTTYTMYIWTGELADVVVHRQLVNSHKVAQWNNIELSSAVTLEEGNDYYFGFRCETEGFPIGTDDGAIVYPEYSDLIRFEDEFISLYNSQGIGANWLISVEFESVEGAASPDYFNVYRNAEIVDTTHNGYFVDTLRHSGEYTYSISAQYGDTESSFSNERSTIFDNERIVRNMVLVEGLVDVNYERAQGIELGLLDLVNNNKKVAPVAYHWRYDLQGTDEPFATGYGIDKSLFYTRALSNLTLPFTMINGSEMIPGGGIESLYQYFNRAYEEQMEIKTPLKLRTEIEAHSNSSFTINVELENVGYVADYTHCRHHLIIVQNKVEYNWFNLDEVNHVFSEAISEPMGNSIPFVDNVANLSYDVQFSPLKDNTHKYIVSIAQDTLYGTVLNCDYKRLPMNKRVIFKATNKGIDAAGVTINVLDEDLVTNENGIVSKLIFDGIDSVAYTASLESETALIGKFNPYSADTVYIHFNPLGSSDDLASQVSIYPNPTSNHVVVSGIDFNAWMLYTLDGRLVRSGENSNKDQQTIVFDGVKTGLYTIKLNTKAGVVSRRLVIE